MFTVLIIYVIVVNFVAFVLYGIDKWKAIHNRWRIRESVLIAIAAFGGAIGALLSMYTFKHKIRKKKFFISVPFFVVVWIVLCGYLFYRYINI